MNFSPGLSGYLAFSERASGFADRRLVKRQNMGKEQPDRISERKGQTSVPRPEGVLVWFHAASVGESLSILELIKRLADIREDWNFLVTTGTVTSANMIASRLPENAIHQFVPVDVRPWIRSFLEHWHPNLAVWTESELWPALMHETHAAEIPMLLINARISRATHRRWRWFPTIAQTLLKQFEFVLAQDDQTRKFLTRLGLPRNKIEVTGTLKEGSAALPCDEEERSLFTKILDRRPVWLAASTHEGEEDIIVAAHKLASRAAQRLLLIIAPRHPERGPEIARKLRKDGWELAVRSEGEIPDETTQIYLADTLGEMGLWYRIAPVSFVGGSMVDIGGHNPFEPAALGSAIIHGPYIHKVRDIYDRLSGAGATIEVRNTDELVRTVGRVLAPDKAAAMAHAAWEISSSGAEVTDRALKLLLNTLEGADGSEVS